VGIALRLDPRHDPARDGDGVAAGGVAHHRDCVLQMLKAVYRMSANFHQYSTVCCVCVSCVCRVCACVCACACVL
jgi:hypothetical protein